MPPPQTDGGCRRRCETKTLKQSTHLHQTEFANPSVFLKRKDLFNNECQRVGDLWASGRGEGTLLPPLSLLPPEGHFWKSPVGPGPGQLLSLSLPAPQLSLCSQNSSGWGEGEEVVYLGWRGDKGYYSCA